MNSNTDELNEIKEALKDIRKELLEVNHTLNSIEVKQSNLSDLGSIKSSIDYIFWLIVGLLVVVGIVSFVSSFMR